MTNPVAFALESAIGAELGLFAIYLLSNTVRRAPAHYLLAGLVLCLALTVLGNMLAGPGGQTGIEDLLLFLDLLAPPLMFLYVTAIASPPRDLTPLDLLHTAPAVIGLAVWKSHLLASMDIYVNACWFGYLAATGLLFAKHFRRYGPQSRQRFLALLLTALVAIWLLRLAIVMQLGHVPLFREGIPYLMILAAVFAVTCLLLFTALRHPELLSVPGSYVKYGLSEGDQVVLDGLHERISVLFDDRKPYCDPDFSLAGLAALLDAPPRQVSQAINLRHGMNVSAYINHHRANFAAELLVSTQKPIKTVLFEAGFRSKSIFNREFQRQFALSPSEYRKRSEGTPVGGS